MRDKLCDERHENCKLRMDSHRDGIKDIYSTRVPWKTFAWTLGVLFCLIMGSYGYTRAVDYDVREVLTKQDMEKISQDIIEAIKGK